jgi:hypothetical protein
MINYRAQTCIEFSSIIENGTYTNIINIDQYDMIIGIPFMHKHQFILDLGEDTLSMGGHTTPLLTSGQEDLMLAKK